MNSYLDIDHICISFPSDNGPVNVLDGVNLKVQKGEFISLIGHSGCGKSTVLNIVAGLLQATEGGVVLEGREVQDPGPDRAVVFQNHSLLPWLSVYDNVRLAVDTVFKKTKSRAERDEWTRHNLELVHMTHALDRKPDEISGGMKQRVGIARALAMEPKVLLMDEPFGALDSLTRTHMQDTLMEIQARLNNTVIMITHDVDEAVLLSDRIVMMTNGPAATVGEILDINLLRPRNRLELAEDPTYNHYRAEVVRFLHERHMQKSDPQPAAAAAPVPSDEPTGTPVLDMSQWRKKRGSGTASRLEKRKLELGFIPLTDCAPLVIAKEKGFFEQHGLDVSLSRESSWANIRDKVSVGMLDGAQMLAAMPLASACGIDANAPMITALSLGLNGNAITVSNELYTRMQASGVSDLQTPMGSAKALKQVIEENRLQGEKPLTFATVFPYSSHNYLLRYWMAAVGIDPDRDVQLIVVPPPQMVHYLGAGMISGFCVGEPWNTQAVSSGLGKILTSSYEVWNNHPEKVFGVTWSWAAENPNTHKAVIAALLEAGAWVDQTENHSEVAELLSQGRYVNAPAEQLAASLSGVQHRGTGDTPVALPDFNVFHRYAATYPWRSHALWSLSQMVRWGQIDTPQNLAAIADKVYRPDIYREVAEGLGLPSLQGDYKEEGKHGGVWTPSDPGCEIQLGADCFFDGQGFSAADPMTYLNQFEIHNQSLPMAEFARVNPALSDEERAARILVSEPNTPMAGGAR